MIQQLPYVFFSSRTSHASYDVYSAMTIAMILPLVDITGIER